MNINTKNKKSYLEHLTEDNIIDYGDRIINSNYQKIDFLGKYNNE